MNHEMESKRAKPDEKEDRISDLPDSIIHHILSFLPSTREAVKTGILSKRWQYQWTRVPVLIFTDYGTPHDNFLNFVEYTLMLHDCSKIKKFRFDYHAPKNKRDPQFAARIRFATRRHVEELHLSSPESLPTFLFNNASLVILSSSFCTVIPHGVVNWGSLSELWILSGKLNDQTIQFILSGSPSLKLLDLVVARFHKLVIASKSLKRLNLGDIHFSTIDISCPSIETLRLSEIRVLHGSHLFAQVIENVVFGSSLLESFELQDTCQLHKMVIASKSLKRLVLGGLTTSGALEISCPKLDNLKLSNYLMFQTPTLVNLPSSLCASLNFIHKNKRDVHMIKDILESLKYVKQLKFGSSFIQLLSDAALKKGHCRFVPSLNIKSLILNTYDLNQNHYGITCVLDKSRLLEELIIKVAKCDKNHDFCEKLNEFGENYWSSNTTEFNCLVSHLKTIKIIGFPCRDHNRRLMLNFVQFLLNNARVLENMVVELKGKDCETTSILKVSQDLSSMSRYSQFAKIECYALSK